MSSPVRVSRKPSGKKARAAPHEARDTGARDENLFDYFALSQLAFVDSATLTVAPFGKPAKYKSLGPAPDGHHILVTTIHKPYSYLVTYDRFPYEVEALGHLRPLERYRSRDRLASDGRSRVPIHGVPVGPRDFSCCSTGASRHLSGLKLLDGGDWNVSVPNRDKILPSESCPFTSPAAEIGRAPEQRYAGFKWSEQTERCSTG